MGEEGIEVEGKVAVGLGDVLVDVLAVEKPPTKQKRGETADATGGKERRKANTGAELVAGEIVENLGRTSRNTASPAASTPLEIKRSKKRAV